MFVNARFERASCFADITAGAGLAIGTSARGKVDDADSLVGRQFVLRFDKAFSD